MTCFAKVTLTTSTVCLVYHRPHFRGTLLVHTGHLLQNHSFSSSANTEHEAYVMYALWLHLQWVINSCHFKQILDQKLSCNPKFAMGTCQ